MGNRQIPLPRTWRSGAGSAATANAGHTGLIEELWAQPDNKLLWDKSRPLHYSCCSAFHPTSCPMGGGGLPGEPCLPTSTWNPDPLPMGASSQGPRVPRGGGAAGVHLQGRAGRSCLAGCGKIPVRKPSQGFLPGEADLHRRGHKEWERCGGFQGSVNFWRTEGRVTFARRAWNAFLANQGASMTTLGGPCACTAIPGAWVYKPERGCQ